MSFASTHAVKRGSYLERAGFIPPALVGASTVSEEEGGAYKAVEQTHRESDRVPMLGVRLRSGAEFAFPYLLLTGVFCNPERGTLTVHVDDGRLHFYGRNLVQVFRRIIAHRAVFLVETPFKHNQVAADGECIEQVEVELGQEARAWLGIE